MNIFCSVYAQPWVSVAKNFFSDLLTRYGHLYELLEKNKRRLKHF